MKNKIYLFSILALVLMSSCTVSQFGYTPEPINQNKIKASASTNVEINNLRVFGQKTTFPNIIKDIEHTMLNEMDEIFTSTSK
ncbi:MAG: hypothetical protein C0599_14730 [Salinivirgaceae bacterium]|nr:MAG: hypothetical protein C0599_14730 [Salinivirgaceae bacterium]